MTKRYMRIDELAAMFGVTPRTIQNWWKSGETCLVAWHPSHRLCRGLLFTSESVKQFEESGRVDPENWIDGVETVSDIGKTQDVVKGKRKNTK